MAIISDHTNVRQNLLNEELKRREAAERERMLTEVSDGGEKVLALDDTQRVRVLSPGRLVAKRFFRNKLAMVGLGILIVMFVFAFLCPIFYPYSQTQIFHTHKELRIDYANAKLRTENASYYIAEGNSIDSSVKNSINSYISSMEAAGKSDSVITDKDGSQYVLSKAADKVYTLSADDASEVAEYSTSTVVAEYSRLGKSFSWKGNELDEEFQNAASSAISEKKSEFSVAGIRYVCKETSKNVYSVTRMSPVLIYDETDETLKDFSAMLGSAANHTDGSAFQWNGDTYRLLSKGNGSYSVCKVGEQTVVMVFSTYVFDAWESGKSFSDSFKGQALLALTENGKFQDNGVLYRIKDDGEVYTITDASGENVAVLSDYAVRRYSGQDTLGIEFKEKVQEVIAEMTRAKQTKSSFVFSLPAMDETANYIKDENGNLSYVDTELNIEHKVDGYVLTCMQNTFVIDIFSPPTAEHLCGTDGDGMDILARMMYGGRISLIVGFVVVILEMILGIIMGGLAGFFGGWIDTLIMRLVDIFYCIPSLPILIIMGAFFDAIKMDPYERLLWLMVILGVLGWAGIARLVRGQILSLREQEFMVAEEATGIRARRRIFRHLIPNVMPQLIVSATMGLGSIIITESTLSYLGLGVKHPLATWGTMINSVTSSSEMMIRYAYIWVPVGFLISLTVIAFNFVGDGLRDAFDPKMKQ